MSNLVPAEMIEKIVGFPRHPYLHYGSAKSEDGLFYILHSEECLTKNEDLRTCEFSIEMDLRGVEFWEVDTPLLLSIDSVVGGVIAEAEEEYFEDEEEW